MLLPSARTVNHVVSLGTNGQTAMYFRRMGYRTFPAPFDWISTDTQTVADVLETDFDTFLEPFKGIHASHVPRTVDMNAYFQRCVHRFRRLGEASGTILCLLIAFDAPDATLLARIHARLLATIGADRLEFVACSIEPNCATTESIFERQSPTFVLWRMKARGHTTGSAFQLTNDTLHFHDTLHKNYAFEIVK